MESPSKNMKFVYTVVRRSNGKSYWVRIGVAFENRDGSWNVKLDATPTNGELQIRDRDQRDVDKGFDKAARGFRPEDFEVPHRRAG